MTADIGAGLQMALRNLRDVDIVTFDELQGKISLIIDLVTG
jgi:hypothetical protein